MKFIIVCYLALITQVGMASDSDTWVDGEVACVRFVEMAARPDAQPPSWTGELRVSLQRHRQRLATELPGVNPAAGQAWIIPILDRAHAREMIEAASELRVVDAVLKAGLSALPETEPAAPEEVRRAITRAYATLTAACVGLAGPDSGALRDTLAKQEAALLAQIGMPAAGRRYRVPPTETTVASLVPTTIEHLRAKRWETDTSDHARIILKIINAHWTLPLLQSTEGPVPDALNALRLRRDATQRSLAALMQRITMTGPATQASIVPPARSVELRTMTDNRQLALQLDPALSPPASTPVTTTAAAPAWYDRPTWRIGLGGALLMIAVLGLAIGRRA